ncbi:amino acid adenylation domain-containing protein [Corynebacterium pygosceleis]|uniref:non-ribosomal peptide synthetase n=1 Tax=Corynebacterium pygosceleis TaxID=2800406 RepID=UPI0020053CE7|nr:amino acid adenylation domain-containing protein [Corynebacterium pygosceleis]
MTAADSRSRRLGKLRSVVRKSRERSGTAAVGGRVTSHVERILLFHRSDPTGIALNIGVAVEFSNPLDRDRLTGALHRVVERHSALRSRYPLSDAGAEMVTDLPGRCPVTVIRGTDPLDAANHDVQIPFRLTAEHPIRVTLVEGNGEGTVTGMAVTVHHVAFDDSCWGPFFTDLSAFYRSGEPLPVLEGPPSVPSVRVDTEFWREIGRTSRFAGWADPGDAVPSLADSVEIPVPPEELSSLRDCAARRRVSVFTLILASVRLAMRRGPGRCAVAVPILLRDHDDGEGVWIGYHGNTVMVPLEVVPGESASEYTTGCGAALLDSLGHGHTDFAEQVRLMGLTGATRGIDVAVASEKVGMTVTIGNGECRVLPARLPVCQMPINVMFRDHGDSAAIAVNYQTARIGAGYARSFLAAVAESMRELVRDDEAVPVPAALSETGGQPAPSRTGILDELVRSVEEHPARIAVSGRDAVLSYAELWAAVEQKAALLRANGVRAGDTVAVVSGRSVQSTVSLLAILRSGAVVTEIDPLTPSDRIRMLLDSAQVKVVVTDNGDVRSLARDKKLVVMDPGARTGGGVGGEEIPLPSPGQIACVIHTSGSTGKPKPVMITHAALGAHVRWFLPTFYRHVEPPRWLHTASKGFDISIGEILCTLAVGGEVIVAPDGVERDPALMVAAVAESRCNIVHAVPTLLRHFLSAAHRSGTELPYLRFIPVGGEAFPTDLAEEVRTMLPQVTIGNFYGPTETTVSVTGHLVSGDEPPGVVAVGHPKTDTSCEILDEWLDPVAEGVTGELYIGGEAVATGYRSMPSETAARFVPAPGGRRRYRTGDLVRSGNGEFHFMGRSDDQVKIGGVRTEPGEISAVVRRCPGIADAVVTISGTAVTAYITATDPAVQPDESSVRASVAEQLPPALVPSRVITLEQFPRTAHGKIDKSALPAPPAGAPEHGGDPEIVAEVVRIFSGVLGGTPVGPGDSFFAVGGHSLLMVEVAAELTRSFDVEVPLSAIFADPTPGGLAVTIGEMLSTGDDVVSTSPSVSPCPGERGPRPDRPPLTEAQRRLWIVDQLQGPSDLYTVPAAVEISGDVDVEQVISAIRLMVERHEVLRTSYPEHEGLPWQNITDYVPDVTVIDTGDETDDALRLLATTVFDITDEVPVRFALLRRGAGDLVLSAVFHHIACDDAAVRALPGELAECHRAVVGGGETGAVAVRRQPADRAVDERHRDDTAAKEYWSRALAGAVPGDVCGDGNTGDGELLSFDLDSDTTALLTEAAAAMSVTRFIVVFAALTAQRAIVSKNGDQIIGVPFSTREAGDDQFGSSVNMLPLRVRVDAGSSFRDHIAACARAAAGAFDHAALSYETITQLGDAAPTASRSSLFREILQFREHDADVTADADGVTFRMIPQTAPTAKYDFAWDFFDRGDGTTGGEFVYRGSLLTRQAAQSMVDLLRDTLVRLCRDTTAPITPEHQQTPTRQRGQQ